jgi:RHS repeat-associated protein
VNNRDTNRTQIFAYDSLNRITSGQSSGSGSLSWGENYNVDSWGNLISRSPVTGKMNTEGLACQANGKNQLTACSFMYDAAGNMTNNPSIGSYTFDAENRIISTAGYVYSYDGDGERVKKGVPNPSTATSCSGSTSGTLYWRGIGTDTLDESDIAENAQEEYVYFNGQRVARRDVSNNAVHYYFGDHLNSTSLVTDAFGSLSICGTYTVPTGEDESDYYPYGGEMVICNRVPQNYKFTGKERDSESGLDYFGARHYSSALGRFMVPDWAGKPTNVPYANFGNPQSLNLYSYVEDNPTTFGDPDGHQGCSSKTGKCTILEKIVNALTFSASQESAPVNVVNQSNTDKSNGTTSNVQIAGASAKASITSDPLHGKAEVSANAEVHGVKTEMNFSSNPDGTKGAVNGQITNNFLTAAASANVGTSGVVVKAEAELVTFSGSVNIGSLTFTGSVCAACAGAQAQLGSNGVAAGLEPGLVGANLKVQWGSTTVFNKKADAN